MKKNPPAADENGLVKTHRPLHGHFKKSEDSRLHVRVTLIADPFASSRCTPLNGSISCAAFVAKWSHGATRLSMEGISGCYGCRAVSLPGPSSPAC